MIGGNIAYTPIACLIACIFLFCAALFNLRERSRGVGLFRYFIQSESVKIYDVRCDFFLWAASNAEGMHLNSKIVLGKLHATVCTTMTSTLFNKIIRGCTGPFRFSLGL